MNISEIHSAVRYEWKNQIADPQGLWTIYDNSDIAPPVDGRNYCKLDVIADDTRRITIGVKQYRTVGLAVAKLFCASEAGDGELLEIAAAVEVAFRDETLSGVKFKTPHTRTIGKITKAGNEYQVNVYIPFDAEDS